MVQIRWLRKLVRKYTNPIPEARASSMKNKLSLFYMFCAWNAFGLVCYMLYTGRRDWAHFYGYKSDEELAVPPAQQWAKTLKFEKVKVIRMSGIHKEQEYEYNITDGKATNMDSEKDDPTVPSGSS